MGIAYARPARRVADRTGVLYDPWEGISRPPVGGGLFRDDDGYGRGAKKAVVEYFSVEAPHILLNRIDYPGRTGVSLRVQRSYEDTATSSKRLPMNLLRVADVRRLSVAEAPGTAERPRSWVERATS